MTVEGGSSVNRLVPLGKLNPPPKKDNNGQQQTAKFQMKTHQVNNTLTLLFPLLVLHSDSISFPFHNNNEL